MLVDVIRQDSETLTQDAPKQVKNGDSYVIHVSPAPKQPAEFQNGEDLSAEQQENFRSLIYDNFLEVLCPVNSPHVGRQWDHPIQTTGSMKRQRLNRLSLAERAELNRQRKDAL
jgi:hypothetical protein